MASSTEFLTVPDPRGDLRVAGAGIGGQEDLRPFQLTRRVPAATQQHRQLITLRLAQLNALSYVHHGLLAERSSDEAIPRAGSSPP